ncbi:MAG TPA: phosphopantothenoylcysteine decarboxylase [Verrucomicrobiae bacterium]|jgi:phosphopantothenoylcysteine decarboxylase/phosphopantothenate--cysteine ligase|nr:phosphopantothenoylcysteine decarboxylase [Verrucomicrobiae bacterium]
MKCVVTAGPTYENLDEVRRLTNFSTGRLGSELARFLEGQGHQVQLLLGYYATWRTEAEAKRTQIFTTTSDLHEKLRALRDDGAGAVFHAAAVSDFAFGKIWKRHADGRLEEVKSAKIPTRDGALFAELTPTPKIIGQLRDWFPQALLVGWKYEMTGDRPSVLRQAERQILECRTDLCVANGRAYGEGFGLVTGAEKFLPLRDREDLFTALAARLKS